jgi:hypothetical protein
LCRPDEATSFVSGYQLPKFLANNFAKGWLRPDISGAISNPLTRRLKEDMTALVVSKIDIVSLAALRASCRVLDIFVRQYFGVVLEESFSLRMAQTHPVFLVSFLTSIPRLPRLRSGS